MVKYIVVGHLSGCVLADLLCCGLAPTVAGVPQSLSDWKRKYVQGVCSVELRVPAIVVLLVVFVVDDVVVVVDAAVWCLVVVGAAVWCLLH